MRFSSRLVLSVVTIIAIVGGFMATGELPGRVAYAADLAVSAHMHVDCTTSPICAEVQNPEEVFGEGYYVGHDEPSVLFYSQKPGSGYENRWQLTLPTDPSASAPLTLGKSYNFELHPAFWFGMAMCDTQSYPEQVSTCTPDSDTNIVDPALSPAHPGTAFMEMQFYPPGGYPWPAGSSCAATRWCAALNIDSLSEDPVHGTTLNSTCAAITGLEYVNFAFITTSGVPQPNSPPNPVQSTLNTFTPNPSADLFMNSGDKLVVTMHDTAHGLQIVIQDKTTGQTGSMTTSAANGFGQVLYAPTGTTCTNIPYDFHPMYSTSSEQTRVIWSAHSYNIAFADETGHFDFCSNVNTTNGTCVGKEGNGTDIEPADANDVGCFPASASTRIQVSGCIGANGGVDPPPNPGFDGPDYQPDWPDGNTVLHPTSILFTSPLTGSGYNVKYNRITFEADLPRIEFSAGNCNRSTGIGCTLLPTTDDGQPASFYPFFSINTIGGQCVWQLGNHIPGSKNDFGQNAQYGTLLKLTYLAFGGGGAPTMRFNDFRQILINNPC